MEKKVRKQRERIVEKCCSQINCHWQLCSSVVQKGRWGLWSINIRSSCSLRSNSPLTVLEGVIFFAGKMPERNGRKGKMPQLDVVVVVVLYIYIYIQTHIDSFLPALYIYMYYCRRSRSQYVLAQRPLHSVSMLDHPRACGWASVLVQRSTSWRAHFLLSLFFQAFLLVYSSQLHQSCICASCAVGFRHVFFCQGCTMQFVSSTKERREEKAMHVDLFRQLLFPSSSWRVCVVMKRKYLLG